MLRWDCKCCNWLEWCHVGLRCLLFPYLLVVDLMFFVCFYQILKERFGMVAPDVQIEDGKGTILISSEEGETEGKKEGRKKTVMRHNESSEVHRERKGDGQEGGERG